MFGGRVAQRGGTRDDRVRGSVIDSATRALRDGSRRQKGRRSGGAAGVQTVIVDVQRDPMFAPHREIAAGSRFRAVQSTPLVDHNGRLLGVISTHYRRRTSHPTASWRCRRCTPSTAPRSPTGTRR
jgi:GAF domain-containing protein